MERDKSFDFIRAICALGIVAFHFSSHLREGAFLPLLSNGNVLWGQTLVTVFFSMSGILLYKNNKSIKLKKYYYKRWKSIFPSFYLAFLYCFAENVLKEGTLFYWVKWAGDTLWNRLSIILTVMGMDGYFLYLRPNYYILGEWFLGAIVILYLAYPIILFLFERSVFAVVIISFIGFCVANSGLFLIDPFRNIFSCLLSFVIGMIIEKYHLLNSKKLALGSAIVFGFLLLIPLNTEGIILQSIHHINGVCLLFVLYIIGCFVMRKKYLTTLFSEIGKISYCIFLLQHLIVLHILKYCSPIESFKVVVLLGIAMVYTCIMAKILWIITNVCLKSKVYLALEEKLFISKSKHDCN